MTCDQRYFMSLSPDEIARAAVFRASDAASFVNGAELFVDSGQAQI
jgi:NAD(P)-dependent dehydrogenase (short-subunit alcohol dehydrogenase family)